MNVSSIMRFEDLLELWQDQHAQQSILEFLGIRSQGDVRGPEESGPGFMRVLHERLDGTWWEVTRSCLPVRQGASSRIQCRYLADSLRDAVRRCPGVEIPPGILVDDPDDGIAEAEDELDFPEQTRGRRRSMAGRADE